MWPKLKEKKSHDIRQCNHSTEMPVASRAAELPVSDVITTNFPPLFLSPPVKTLFIMSWPLVHSSTSCGWSVDI